ncbi:protein EFR3 homolog B-like [Lampris incognitus]|uniref:protein EFR3 homolog B-like n=1 Tax=Lampris incognitus TaxID=2546036 RepID=UPI0024B58B1E|nr:protein EFR3 homolog B-like [Lampris incognitus]
MYGMCGCCSALRPRYKRLVDNIFPEDPEEGLVRANMEKLTFYALSAPEKLDRIGAYLSERLSRDVARHRYGYVCIAMEALEQLLMACHCQSINLFVESFLTMVRKLLEADKPNLQILGTNSFVKFANIEEDTASYHRSYDFFVSRFSEMCHSNYEDPDIRTKIRLAGIRGLQGVVRKTVNDELQVNIWEPRHMEKIIPSLLFNLLQDPNTHSSPGSQIDRPVEQTERCFRELLSRAAYGHINTAIRPVLMHLDNHGLWEGRSLAVRCFQIIMFSIQSQHSHLVIQQLLGHLDANSQSPASVRAGIVEVLSEAAVIEASGSVGPTVLEVFNTLLRQLRQSVDYQLTGFSRTSPTEETQLQEAVIRTIGSFANKLPIYQRSEVMLFIMGKIPVPGIYPVLGSPNSGFEGSRMIQVMLLKSLLQVAQSYDSTNMLTALPSSFLQPLLSYTLMEDPEIRLLVLSILTSLIDRHHNASTLKTIRSALSDVSVLNLKVDKCSQQDNLFMRKHAQRLYRHIFLGCKEENSGRSHYEALFMLLALLSVELASEEVVVDLVRLVLALQELALANQEQLSVYNRCAIHALSAAFLSLLSHLTSIPAFCQHVRQVIEFRQKEMPYLLPSDLFTETPRLPEAVLDIGEQYLFIQTKISEIMGGNGYNTDKLNTSYTPQISDEDRLSKRKSIGDVVSLQDMEPHYNPEIQQKSPVEQITFETLKSTIVDGGSVEEQERRRQLVERFQTAPFEEIAAHCGARASLLQSKLEEIFEVTIRALPSPSGGSLPRSTPLYEMKFPDLCVY